MQHESKRTKRLNQNHPTYHFGQVLVTTKYVRKIKGKIKNMLNRMNMRLVVRGWRGGIYTQVSFHDGKTMDQHFVNSNANEIKLVTEYHR